MLHPANNKLVDSVLSRLLRDLCWAAGLVITLERDMLYSFS